MIRDENQSDSIFNKENDFALVMASICIAKRLSNDPLSNQIVVQAIERASSLSEPAFLDTVRSLVEEENLYNNRDDQNEKDSNDYSMDEEMIDDKLSEAEEDDENRNEDESEDEDENRNEDESEDEDDADYETEEENLLDLEDKTDKE